MTAYLSLPEVATAIGQPTATLMRRLADLGLIGSEARPSMCALLARVAKKFPYTDGEGKHAYGWSLERVSVLIREEA